METLLKLHPLSAEPAERKLLTWSIILLLFINYVTGYIGHTYYSDSLLDIYSPGFWLFTGTFALITGIVVWNKNMLQWSWSDLGLGKPRNWWKPLLVAVLLYGTCALFMTTLAPFLMQFGERPNMDHLLVLRGNLPMLVFALVIVWITAAFLEEFIFRAYLINSLEKILKLGAWSPWIAVLISSVLFGLVHAYQGAIGILLTGSLGLIFGVFFLFNGRRIWPLILVHGIIDTIGFINIYNM